jgi:hypothetical protein
LSYGRFKRIIFMMAEQLRGPFDEFVKWRQCAAVMQLEVVTVMPILTGEGNGVVA